MSVALLSQSTAFRLWNAGELMTYVEFNEQNTIALQAVLHLLGRMCIDTASGEPASGFVGDECLSAKGAGDLEYTIEPGMGFQYVSSSSGAWEIGYQPVLVPAQLSGAVGAHDASNPRIDLLVIQATTDDDSAENRSVKDTATGSVSTQSVNTRRVYSATVQVVAGTPATVPTRPAVPSGYIEIAEINVPATSGAITVTDTRSRLSIGQDWASDPPKPYAHPHVVQGHGGNLGVGVGTGLEVLVAAGEIWIQGRRHRHVATALSLTAAHTSLDRIDLVVCHRTTGPKIITGTPASSPTAPLASLDEDNEVVLAQVEVAATVSSLSSGDLTDERDLQPYSGDDQLQRRQMPINRLQNPPLKFNISEGSRSGNSIPLSISTKDGDGLDLFMPVQRSRSANVDVRLLATVYDDGWERLPSSGATGMQLSVSGGATAVSTTGRSGLVFDTDTDGTATLTVTRADPTFTGTIYVKLEPIIEQMSLPGGYAAYEAVSGF